MKNIFKYFLYIIIFKSKYIYDIKIQSIFEINKP